MPLALDATAANAPVATPATGPATRAAPGFAEALAAQTAPGRPQTVALGTMLSAFAGAPIETAAIGGDPASAATSIGTAAAVGPAGAATGAGAAVMQAGERYIGVPYLWGGTHASTGFDCSGFVQQVFSDLGVSLPRVSKDQSKAGVEVPGGLSAAQPGDLIYWNGVGGRPNHIGIYAGDGMMLDAPRSGEVIGYREITRGAPDHVRRVAVPG